MARFAAWRPTNGPGAMPSNQAPPVAEDAPASTDAADDDLPAPDPIKGRVPLPRNRPNLVVVAQNGATVTPAAPATSGVPLPRARPSDAPEAPPAAALPDVIYERDTSH